MLAQVKKVFKPEFINRLSGTVVFHDMDIKMANLILDKKIGALQAKLTDRKVQLHLNNDAREWMLKRGFTPLYGAREIDRVINTQLKPLIVHQLLFGKMKRGGDIVVSVHNDQLTISAKR